MSVPQDPAFTWNHNFFFWKFCIPKPQYWEKVEFQNLILDQKVNSQGYILFEIQFSKTPKCNSGLFLKPWCSVLRAAHLVPKWKLSTYPSKMFDSMWWNFVWGLLTITWGQRNRLCVSCTLEINQLQILCDFMLKWKKKKNQMILSALCPLLCNSTWPQHTLQMFTDHCGPRQTIPWETINQGLLQPQGELYPIQTIFSHRSWDQLLKFCTSFYEKSSSEFLVQGNFKHTQFSREHWYWRYSNSQPLVPKASAVSIELTWLPFWSAYDNFTKISRSQNTQDAH